MRSFIVFGFALLTLTTLHTESAWGARYLRQSAFDCRPSSANLVGGVEVLGPSTSNSVKSTGNDIKSDVLICAFPGTSRFSASDVTGVNVHGFKADDPHTLTVIVCREDDSGGVWGDWKKCTFKQVTTTGNWTVTFSAAELPVSATNGILHVEVGSLYNGDTLRGVFYYAP